MILEADEACGKCGRDIGLVLCAGFHYVMLKWIRTSSQYSG